VPKKAQITQERVEYNVFLFDEPLKGSKLLKIYKISLTFCFDKLSNLSKSVHTGENSQILTVSNKKFNLLKDTQPHYIYKPESCLENDNYKLYFDRTVLTDIHIQHNRPDIIILNKQQKQAYLLDIAVPNSHNITQTYTVVPR
jgi:hypothetical protein